MPLQQSPVIVEPYNTALATHHVLDMVNCSFLFNNKSLYDICSSKLNFTQTTYRSINSIIALVRSYYYCCTTIINHMFEFLIKCRCIAGFVRNHFITPVWRIDNEQFFRINSKFNTSAQTSFPTNCACSDHE